MLPPPKEQRERGEKDPPEKPQNAVQAAIGIASSLLALGAYVYLLGGFVLWLKFTAARLPTDDAVGGLDGNRMLAVGMKALVFEVVLVAALLGLAFLAWESVRFLDVKSAKREKRRAVKEGAGEKVEKAEEKVAAAAVLDSSEKWEAWRKALQALIVAILVGSIASGLPAWFFAGDSPTWLGPAVGAGAAALWVFVLRDWIVEWARRNDKRRAAKTWLTVIAAILAVTVLAAPAGVGVLLLLLFLHLSHFLKELHKVTDPANLIPAVLIVAGGLSLVVAVYLATPPVSLDDAVVVMDGPGHHAVHGGYVGRSGDGIYLAVCLPDPSDPRQSATTRLRVVSAAKVRRIVLGGESGYVFDDGKDPSLFDIARYVVSREPLAETLETVALDVRERELTCGFPHDLRIVKRPRDRATGNLWLAMTVPGEGTLSVSGDGLRTQRVNVEAGWYALPVRRSPRVLAAHRCEGPSKATVQVRFTHGDHQVELKSARVVLAGLIGPGRKAQAQACHRAWVHRGTVAAPRRGAPRSNAR
ncbi:MAG TPA: hypothetical protein VLK37_04990 [Solirubrobacterales bacterium]|nr:hypothetical protein [Solirubrobacterales bacterium]